MPPALSRRAISSLVEEGRYEEAIGVRPGAARKAVMRAHILALRAFRDDPGARDALNRAAGALAAEGPEARARRIVRLGRTLAALGMIEEALPYLERADDFRIDPLSHDLLEECRSRARMIRIRRFVARLFGAAAAARRSPRPSIAPALPAVAGSRDAR